MPVRNDLDTVPVIGGAYRIEHGADKATVAASKRQTAACAKDLSLFNLGFEELAKIARELKRFCDGGQAGTNR